MGREWLRHFEAELPIEGIPCDAQRPLTLCAVCGGFTACTWEIEPPCPHDPRGLILCVVIPLRLTVRDACGCVHQGESSITVRVRTQMKCAREECWSNQWVVLPSVRLSRCAYPACDDVFVACLEVCVDAYLVRPEPVCRTQCRPACPPLPPMYPAPYYGGL